MYCIFRTVIDYTKDLSYFSVDEYTKHVHLINKNKQKYDFPLPILEIFLRLDRLYSKQKSKPTKLTFAHSYTMLKGIKIYKLSVKQCCDIVSCTTYLLSKKVPVLHNFYSVIFFHDVVKSQKPMYHLIFKMYICLLC